MKVRNAIVRRLHDSAAILPTFNLRTRGTVISIRWARLSVQRSALAVRPRLILASASPRRRELLAQLGVPFDVVVAEVTEHEDPATDPRVMVAHNAALKADWVAARHPEALVLGADTTVFIDHHVLNKPRDLAEARAMLRRLSGRTHTVFTGLALRRVQDGLRVDEGVASDVTFKPFDDATIEAYLSRRAYPRQGRRLRDPGAAAS